MITQYKITFATGEHMLYVDSAYKLYAYLLEALDYEVAQWLHDEGSRGVTQYLLTDRTNGTCCWTINLLNDEVATLLCPVLEGLDRVCIEQHNFPVTGKAVRQVSMEDLLLSGRQGVQNKSVLSFVTVTSFKHDGRYVIFPQERLILQSLIHRWNEVFPQCSLEDEDAFQALLQGIHIVDYRLRSTRFRMKGVRIPGFMGTCTVEAKLALPLLEIWNTLLAFSEYAGVGMKTGLGMGAVERKALLT